MGIEVWCLSRVGTSQYIACDVERDGANVLCLYRGAEMFDVLSEGGDGVRQPPVERVGNVLNAVRRSEPLR